MKKLKFTFSYSFMLFFVLSGCTNNLTISAESTDPFEVLNRNIFTFNKTLDRNIVSPISATYVKTMPHSVRKSVSNHLEWMDTPSTIVNSALQIDLENTILASAKFMLNGLSLGFYDFDNNETKIKKKDLGSTLAKLNVPEGPFLMVPFLGPKTVRDFTGTLSDRQSLRNISSNSVNKLSLAEIPVNLVDKRSKLAKNIENIYESPDPYTKMKSYYIQNRRKNVYGDKYIEVKNNKLDMEFEKLLQ
ncbi:VacJ family lipoprotein [Alphaproteobacteria bacterium]|nr:VacJ family lipoprotein [Alphaproteobacteria bacterium]